jgi:hypothetical protein
MKFAGICARAALLALASTVLTSLSLAQQHPPIDPHAVSQTRFPHVNSQIAPKKGPGPNNGNGSNIANIGGTPYSVGPTITLTTSVSEANETIAVDPMSMNNLVAVVSDYSRDNYNTTKYAVSFNNGDAGTWSECFVPLSAGLPATGDFLTWEANSAPAVAIDKLGNVYLSNLYLNAGNTANGLYVSVGQLTSPCLGLSAHATYPVATNPSTTTNMTEDKDWITVDTTDNLATSGNVYVSWTHFVNNGDARIYFSRSTNHGQTWSAAPIQVSDTWQNGSVQGSQMAVGPGGVLYLVYEVFFQDNMRAHYLVKSTDGGATFSPSVAITPTFNELSIGSTYRTNSFPSLAVDPVSGVIYVIYSDQPNATVGAEVEFILSGDGGTTFTQPASLVNPSKGQQFLPAIAVDGTGEIHVSWFDTRNDFKSTSSYDIYATSSVSGGSKFSTNARVTPNSISTGGTFYIGDYMGIAASAGFAHPVWTSGGWNNGSLQTSTLH